MHQMIPRYLTHLIKLIANPRLFIKNGTPTKSFVKNCTTQIFCYSICPVAQDVFFCCCGIFFFAATEFYLLILILMIQQHRFSRVLKLKIKPKLSIAKKNSSFAVYRFSYRDPFFTTWKTIANNIKERNSFAVWGIEIAVFKVLVVRLGLGWAV